MKVGGLRRRKGIPACEAYDGVEPPETTRDDYRPERRDPTH